MPLDYAAPIPAPPSASIVLIVLRRLRAPLIALVVIYVASIVGLTVVPGVDAAGKPSSPMSFFHAFYFMSYTATTIGFGEIPMPFSDAQRLWVTLCIYLSVVGWTYAILTLLALFQDRAFADALARARFGRRVRRLGEPFYIVCGCGETGQLITRALDRRGTRFVVVELKEAR
ncbi:MAG: potassium transporter TrkA, partial [Betaproteobacteria bacterium]|nr:potassium transporter TrkA [Betaproteobacteria bacterium]